jgi:hypothetical protein
MLNMLGDRLRNVPKNILGKVVALPYLPPDEPGKGFAATPRQVPSGWKEARVHYSAMTLLCQFILLHALTCTNYSLFLQLSITNTCLSLMHEPVFYYKHSLLFFIIYTVSCIAPWEHFITISCYIDCVQHVLHVIHKT